MDVVLQKDLFERSREVFSDSADKFSIKYHLTDVLDEEKMLQLHRKGIKCFVIGAEAYSKDFYQSLEEGSVVIRYGVGYNAVPIDICRQRKIKVAYTPGTLTDSVAEYAMSLILSLAKNIPYLHSTMMSGIWQGRTGLELKNKTLAILGYGQIGRSVARIAKLGFGMKIHAFDKYGANDGIADLFTGNFEEAVAEADIISIHMTATTETQNYINKETIDKFKTGALLVNTSRGNLINESDLYDALSTGKLAGAAIDVFLQEPYLPISEDADLRNLKNVILTPHCGSNSKEASNRMAQAVVRNINAFAQEKEMTIIPELK